MASSVVFSYKRINDSALRPIIPIKLSFGQESINQMVLVDSGADFCVFRSEVGEALGIAIETGMPRMIGGINGEPLVGHVHMLDLTVGNYKNNVPVVFVDGLTEWGYEIVGQIGFFDQFKVSFDYSKKTDCFEAQIKN